MSCSSNWWVIEYHLTNVQRSPGNKKWLLTKIQLSCPTGKYNIIADVLIIFPWLKQKGGQKVLQRECLLSVALLESKTDPLGGLIHTAHKKVVHFFSVLLWFLAFLFVLLCFVEFRCIIYSCVLLCFLCSVTFCCVLLRFVVVLCFCVLFSCSCVEFFAFFFSVLSVWLCSILFRFVVFCYYAVLLRFVLLCLFCTNGLHPTASVTDMIRELA